MRLLISLKMCKVKRIGKDGNVETVSMRVRLTPAASYGVAQTGRRRSALVSMRASRGMSMTYAYKYGD